MRRTPLPLILYLLLNSSIAVNSFQCSTRLCVKRNSCTAFIFRRQSSSLLLESSASRGNDGSGVEEAPVTSTSSSPTLAASSPSCWNPRLRGIMGAIATFGAVETAYLTYSKLSRSSSMGMCPNDLLSSLWSPSSTVSGSSCGSVLDGPYSVVPGTDIPIAAIGFVAYSCVASLALGPLIAMKLDGETALSLLDDEDDDGEATNRIALSMLSTAMGVFSIFLMSLLFGVLKASCAYCVLSALLSIALAQMSWMGGALPSTRLLEGVQKTISAGTAAFVGALILFLSVGGRGGGGGGAVSDVEQAIAATASAAITTTTTAAAQGSTTTTTEIVTPTPPPAVTTTSSTQAMALADKLRALDTRFYGAFWCGHCYDQKQAMGKEAMALIPYIECSKDGLNSEAGLCRDRDIPGYPTWEISNELYPGERTLEELEEIVDKVMLSK